MAHRGSYGGKFPSKKQRLEAEKKHMAKKSKKGKKGKK